MRRRMKMRKKARTKVSLNVNKNIIVHNKRGHMSNCPIMFSRAEEQLLVMTRAVLMYEWCRC